MSMDPNERPQQNLYGSNRPESEDSGEPNVHDLYAPEELDEEDLRRFEEEQANAKKAD